MGVLRVSPEYHEGLYLFTSSDHALVGGRLLAAEGRGGADQPIQDDVRIVGPRIRRL